MSATYEAALRDLNDAAGVTGDLGLAERGIAAQIGTGRAILACAEELEALVELVRERLAPPTPDRVKAPVIVEHADGNLTYVGATSPAAGAEVVVGPPTTSPAPPDPGVRHP